MAHIVLGRIRADFLFNNYAFMVINADDIIYKSNVSFLYAVLSFLISFCYCTWNFFMIFILQQHCIFFVFQYYIHIETSLTTQNILLKFSFNENWWFLGSHILYLSPLLLYSHWQSTVSIIFLSWPHKSSWKTMRHTKRKKIEWVGHKKE